MLTPPPFDLYPPVDSTHGGGGTVMRLECVRSACGVLLSMLHFLLCATHPSEIVMSIHFQTCTSVATTCNKAILVKHHAKRPWEVLVMWGGGGVAAQGLGMVGGGGVKSDLGGADQSLHIAHGPELGTPPKKTQ